VDSNPPWTFTRFPPNLDPSMVALAQLLASHASILVLDAASASVQVGLLRAGREAIWRESPDEAGKALFILADACLQETGLRLNEVTAFVFCEGPGSMLGIRTAAMAIRTWQTEKPRPAYCYRSLTLLAYELRRMGEPPPFSVIADARRDTWHRVLVEDSVSALQRIPGAELAASNEPLWQPATFRTWSPSPRAARDIAYPVGRLLAAHDSLDLFTSTEAPDAFQHAAPEYKKWSAQIHRATVTPAGPRS
jgi:tRNA threonylcarbamoyladenosine biosynthesis protein TsaB